MSGDFGIVYPLWTDPRGPGKLLDQAAGEVGLDHLTIPVVSGQQEQFRLSPAQPPHCFLTEGGWHFPPDLACYRGGPVRPRPARWFGKRDVLGRVCEYAAGRNVPAIFRLDLRGVSGLAEHEPHLRTRNAWGDEVVLAGACTSSPDLRELLHGTLEDLRRYEPAGFQLADWAPDVPIDRAAPRPLDWHPLARRLANVCFCPACRQIATMAGADPEHAARSVQVHVQRLLTRQEDSDVVADMHSDEVLDAYLQARRRDTAAWLRQLAETHPDRRRYLLGDVGTGELTGSLLLRAEKPFVFLLRAGKLVRDGDEDAPKAVFRGLAPTCGVTLPVWRPSIDQADRLARLVTDWTREGITFFDFEGLDEAPEEAIDWLRRAVRYARRG